MTFKMSLILKIYKPLLCKLNVLKRVLIRNLYFCNGSNLSHLKTLTEGNYQVAEKEKDDLHEHEEHIFDKDEDDTITVLG